MDKLVTDKTPLFEAHTDLKIEDNTAIIKNVQHIPDSFFEDLRAKREDTKVRESEMMHVASIPEYLVNRWYAQGFNIFDKNVTTKDILKRLNSEEMQHLMATNKRI